MASEITTMGRNQGLTESQVLEIMKNTGRPVWSARDMADYTGVTRKTAHKRLKSLANAGKVESMQVGNATMAYYLVGIETQPVGDGEEPIKRDIRRSFENEFFGDNSAPSQVSTFDGVAEAGDKIQFVVEGRPGEWRERGIGIRLYENRREELHYNETDKNEVQALASGELYERPTVPIEHVNYPPDWNLELNIGPHIEETEKGSALIATGVKNHLIRPCDNALFLENVQVEWLCPIGEGQELETAHLGAVLETADNESSKRPPEVQEAINKLQEEEQKGDSPDFQPEPEYKADIVTLSDDCEPKRAYLEASKSEGADYRVIPADFEGNELGADYEPTDQFKKEVREKAAVDGDLQFERTWMED